MVVVNARGRLEGDGDAVVQRVGGDQVGEAVIPVKSAAARLVGKAVVENAIRLVT